MRLPSTTPHPASFSAGSTCSARVSASFISCFHQLKTDLVTVERNLWRHRKSAADSLIILLSDDDGFYCLPFFGQLVLNETHIAKRLTDDSVACPTFF